MTKVLIVEDDPLLSRMYQRVFTFEKFDVQMAENGKVGLEKLQTFKPDIMLVDVMMPVMNGMEMLASVKKNPDTKAIPVIMLTNLADQHTAEEAIKTGALQYIVKTKYSPDEIAGVVRETLAHPAKAAS